ncbi:cytochrome C oxidase subunit IV [Arthrobacter sp. MYb211]|uniref:cytochrome c oxidase subunit 4 n=1 Tax=Micrococcaceae TaxID=1268 RepID=UPI000CFBF30D|nr:MULTISPECIES: cytochrome c oxidase subunit 4 [unclassified Arthrobacter]PRA01112.1 cytochrome C oxidase subunit IV [Arthrobacter sp. MYb224]PRA06726.1 cytochrome C oxidase subunit IV [Arthrobacter sp. MYb229]PRA13867.1 cytochrome C oxidase subunit IV [Arthrobacter sp. MYb221]PRB53627.1 cytochrome C oxidase subunit IV [Arthrobacter sp. MYb216]PRC09237.1 cytochrome C oxidase subunit IV [Arthrobacter sp. MYb211]
MKVESWLFLGGIFFFTPVAIVYGYMTNWNEWVGLLALLMLTGLSAMVGGYLFFTAKRVGARPEDRIDGEIHENAGDLGLFSPWSWWPLVLAGAAAIGFLGLAVGWWVFYIGAGLSVVALVGWVYEYSRGDHAH